MPERMIFLSQIELDAAASTPKEAVRKQEFDAHVNNDLRHLPTGGLTGQVLVMTASGLAWKWPSVVCGCDNHKPDREISNGQQSFRFHKFQKFLECFIPKPFHNSGQFV